MGNAIINHADDSIKVSGRQARRPYALLAAAILKRGVLENDQTFLESDWAESLRMLATSCDYSLQQDPVTRVAPRHSES